MAMSDANIVPVPSAIESFYLNVLSATGADDLSLRAEQVMAADWESIGDYKSKPKTRTEFLTQLSGFAQIIPDLKWTIIEVLSVGRERYVVRGRATGTPIKPLLGVEPNGNSFDILTIDIHTIREGKIVRSYHVEDWAGAQRQLRT